MEIKYNVTGQDRKRLVGAVSQQLNQPMKYLGAPTFAYEVGGYRIDKEATVTGADDTELVAALREAGFDSAGKIILDCHRVYEPSDAEADPSGGETDSLTVEVPLEGFTPETLDNLTKMVLSKEALLKKALGAEDLPVKMATETLQFPWFTLTNPGDAAYYVQFVYALCKTAKEKKRVTAKPAETDNEKFSLRVWLISLGMVGAEYKKARSLLLANMSGNSSFKDARSKERWDAKHGRQEQEVAVNE